MGVLSVLWDRKLGTVLLLGAVLWIVAHVANLLPAIAFAIAIIFVLNPVVTRLRRHGVPHVAIHPAIR